MNSRKMAMVMLATVLSSLKVLAQEEGDVNERALKYGVINFEFPPYLYYDKETNLPYKGFFYDVLQGFGKQLNRTIELVPVPDFFTDLDITAFMSRRIREGMIDFGWSNRADFMPIKKTTCIWISGEHELRLGLAVRSLCCGREEDDSRTLRVHAVSRTVLKWRVVYDIGFNFLGRARSMSVLLMNNNHMNNDPRTNISQKRRSITIHKNYA